MGDSPTILHNWKLYQVDAIFLCWIRINSHRKYWSVICNF
jgi:hypothetical protein